MTEEIKHRIVLTAGTGHNIDHALRFGLDGHNAYELAVKAGFAGTESEWLASLHGADAGIEGLTVSVDDAPGTPSARVTAGGTPQARTFHIALSGLKGRTPALTIDEQNNLYSDGALLSDAVKRAVETAVAQTARVRAYADHPPVIVSAAGNGYWAFWDEASGQYVTSAYRSDDGMLTERPAGASVELDVEPGRIYLCGELRSLRLRSVPDDARLSLVRFTSGAVATELSLPEGLPTAGWRIPQPHASYAIFLQAATALIVRYDP